MKLTVNGQIQELPCGATVRTLVVELGLTDRPVAVEVNKQLVPRARHQQTKLEEGDHVELVTLVGGG